MASLPEKHAEKPQDVILRTDKARYYVLAQIGQNNVSFSGLLKRLLEYRPLFCLYTCQKSLLDTKSRGAAPLVCVSIGSCHNLVLLLADFALYIHCSLHSISCGIDNTQEEIEGDDYQIGPFLQLTECKKATKGLFLRTGMEEDGVIHLPLLSKCFIWLRSWYGRSELMGSLNGSFTRSFSFLYQDCSLHYPFIQQIGICHLREIGCKAETRT